MIKSIKRWFNAAAVLSFFFASALALGTGPDSRSSPVRDHGSGALAALLDAAVPSGCDGLSRENPRLSAPVPEISPEPVRAAAPEPGKDLVPAVHDQARVKAILKLISDIYCGNHLPYSQDGAVFTNREGKLPARPKGYYREYTLLTGNAPHTVTIGETVYQVAPDLSARGSERIIIGGGENIYYTPDHYKNFIQLAMVY